MFKVNNRNTRTRCEICSKLNKLNMFKVKQGVKYVQRCFTPCPSVSIVNFEPVNADFILTVQMKVF